MDDGLIRRLEALAPEERARVLDALAEPLIKVWNADWPSWAHGGQEPPHDDWSVWVILAGRGFGKTRAGAEYVSEFARAHPEASIALVAATREEARRVMVEGRSGLIATARPGDERDRMLWEPSRWRLEFASGAEARLFSAASPDSLRGPEHDLAWCDELAKWPKSEAAWDNLLLGLRAGERPRAIVTTTPRAGTVLGRVLETQGLVLTGGATRGNPHLPEAFIAMVEAAHKGTRFARQELEGVLIEEPAGALWPADLLERSRSEARRPAMADGWRRILVAVDPPGSAEGDECGIVVCGLDREGVGHVLADLSQGGLSPEGWAARAAAAAESWRAERVIAEANNGGAMVSSVLKAAGLKLPVKAVHAADGKVARAAPVATLFESGAAKLAGRFPELEAQLSGLCWGGGYEGPGRSPDRADAMVWGLTELLLTGQRGEPAFRRL